MNHHGPLEVNSGGSCGGNSMANNIVRVMQNESLSGGEMMAGCWVRTQVGEEGHRHRGSYRGIGMVGLLKFLADVSVLSSKTSEEVMPWSSLETLMPIQRRWLFRQGSQGATSKYLVWWVMSPDPWKRPMCLVFKADKTEAKSPNPIPPKKIPNSFEPSTFLVAIRLLEGFVVADGLAAKWKLFWRSRSWAARKCSFPTDWLGAF